MSTKKRKKARSFHRPAANLTRYASQTSGEPSTTIVVLTDNESDSPP
jgi:hypothetical protein